MLEDSADSDTSYRDLASFRKTKRKSDDLNIRRRKLRSTIGQATPISAVIEGREWVVMYGIEDHMAFYISIKHPSAFCDENVGVYTLDDRCRWNIGEEITICWGGKSVACKIDNFCSTEVEAKKFTTQLSERLTENSMMEKVSNASVAPRDNESNNSSDCDDEQEDESRSTDSTDSSVNVDPNVIAAKNRQQNDSRIAIAQSQFPVNGNRSGSTSATYGRSSDILPQLLELSLQQQEMLKEQQKLLNFLCKKVAKKTNCLRRMERMEGSHRQNLIWMGVDASKFFNESFSSYDCGVNKYSPNLGLLMWGERICFYYCVPAGNRTKSGSQRRLLLKDKDPSGVDCMQKVIEKLLLEQQRCQARSLSESFGGDGALDSRWRGLIDHDRKEVLSQISQKGLDMLKKRNFTTMAQYYSLIENGHYPNPAWTSFSEAFDDSQYRAVQEKAFTKESSAVIEVAQKLFDNKENDTITESHVREYKAKYPFLRL